MAKHTHTFTLTAPDSKKFALWVTMWAGILSVLHVMGIQVQGAMPTGKAPKAKPVKPIRAKAVKVTRAAKATRKAKPAPVKRAVRKQAAKPVQPVAVKVEPEPAFIEIPFSRETYRFRHQLGELGAKSNRAAKLWVIPAANADRARALLTPPKVQPAPVAPPAPKVQPVKAAKQIPAYIGKPRAEFSSWLSSRGYQAPTVERPSIQPEPAPVTTIDLPGAYTRPVEARKVPASPKGKRSASDILADLSESASEPTFETFGRHKQWVRQVNGADLAEAVRAMKATRLVIAGTESTTTVLVSNLKSIVQVSRQWKSAQWFMNSTIGLVVRFQGRHSRGGQLIAATYDTPARIETRDYVIALPNDRESTKAA